MSIEYYIVKPNKKEIICIGKHLLKFSGISEWCFSKEAKSINYINFENFFKDILENNVSFFDNCIPLPELKKFISYIYEFCDEPVYLDSDCSGNTQWHNFIELDGIYEFYEHYFNKSHKDALEDLDEIIVTMIPKSFWYVTDNIIQPVPTLVNFIKSTRNIEKGNNNDER